MAKKEQGFSKRIMKMEMRLLCVNTLGVLGLAYYSVYKGFDAGFPWLTAMVGLPWTAWGVSKTGYTMKSTKENTPGGIVYEMAMLQAGQTNPQADAEIPEEEILRDL